MPYLDDSPPRGDTAKIWQKFIKHSILRRLRPAQLTSAIKELQSKHRAKPKEIAELLMRFRARPGGLDEPLLFRYAELLVREKYITSSDLLLALLQNSGYGERKAYNNVTRRTGMPSCEEQIFTLLMQHHAHTGIPTAALELQNIIFAIWRWMKAVCGYEMGKQLETGGMHTLDAYYMGMYEALGNLAVIVLGNQSIRVLAKQKWWKEKRALVVTEMRNYDTHVLQWMNSQRGGQLNTLTSMLPFIELDEKGRPKFTNDQILASVSEVASVNSRAGLFIWLDAALVALPSTQDPILLSHLQARYPGDPQSMMVDLMAAAFDVLTNAILRKESRQDVKVARSFLCNKVPVVMAMLSGNMPPGTADTCIQMALVPGGMISMDPLPPITAGANEVRENLKQTRLDFLQACALHGLTSENTISGIIQGSVTLPRVIKQNKDTLVAQCTNNISRFEAILEDVEAMQGNAAAISGCVFETVNNLCMSKDTMSLKSACNALLKKIPRMDIILQYGEPRMLLSPLCTLLSDWMHDQDQSEFTPQYEEFASILLLTLALIHRYDLELSELGLMGNFFLGGILDDFSKPNAPNELSPEQSAQLGKWVEGLFTVDDNGETSGISDEVMRHCAPQAFYRLVPTLFQHSVLACKSNAMKMKAFKGGLELLLEPFLIPSLVLGLKWLAQHSWEDHGDADVLLQALDKLLKPSSSSEETKAMHRAVLSIVATPLFASLQELHRKRPDKKQATALSDLLKPYVGQQRSLSCSKSEMDDWLQQDSDISSHIQRSARDLTVWGAHTSNPPNPPPKFTYKEFASAQQILEHGKLLDAVLDDLKRSANLPVALDVWISMICAPTVQRANSPASNFQNSVRLTGSNISGLLEKPRAEAEALVRLGRRVEAQITVAQMPPISMPLQMEDQATADQLIQDMGLDLTGNEAATNGDGGLNQHSDLAGLDQALDLTNPSDQEIADMAANAGTMNFDEIAMNMGQVSQSSQQMSGQDDDDIFADLNDMEGMGDMGMDDLEDFNFG
ncbi:Mediator of RNA polymerase II transcription subunit 5 [Lecanosticta acicola]|uniref:Mediator of RNA polymerase II transcription subunit 5 n=1 Tax=Lecanosticta acicola TaxID=111012 RepID=A0AAI8YYR0_9PEZI|nr:Mediator of RNA polymerase II transcription subunit 5 [Lecanosticta acicola]